MQYPRTPASYEARAARAAGVADVLNRKLRNHRAYYDRHPDATPRVPIEQQRADVELARLYVGVAQAEVARLEQQRPTPVRAARLAWRRVEVEIAELKLRLHQLHLAQAERLARGAAA